MKILLPVIVVLALFATSVMANHALYAPGDYIYRDSGLIACSTKEESLKAIQSITTVKYLTYAVARKIAEANNCNFYRDPVNFTISDMLCNATRADKRIFSIVKASVIVGKNKKFTILFTDSETPVCEK